MDEDAVRRALLARRGTLDAELARLTTIPRDPMTAVSFGKRVGDGTTEAVERINTTATAETFAELIAAADRALAKLDEGTYGSCDSCGDPIPEARLEVIPWTAFCVACSAAR